MPPAQNQNEVAVTAGTARARGLRRISDLGPVAHSLTLATPRRRSWLYRLAPAVLLIATAGEAVFMTRRPYLASASD